jgi:hypothetical protein
MSELADNLTEAVDKARESTLNSLIAACVAIVATFMALCNVKDGNIVQAMAQAQASSVDQWAYYQAKGTKENLAQSSVDMMTLMRDTTPNIAPDVKKQFDERIAVQQANVKRYETEKAEIKKQAEDSGKQYDALNVHDDQFDMGEALCSVAIALFGVTALTQKRWLLAVAALFAIFGLVLGAAGFMKLNLHPDFLAKFLG